MLKIFEEKHAHLNCFWKRLGYPRHPLVSFFSPWRFPTGSQQVFDFDMHLSHLRHTFSDLHLKMVMTCFFNTWNTILYVVFFFSLCPMPIKLYYTGSCNKTGSVTSKLGNWPSGSFFQCWLPSSQPVATATQLDNLMLGIRIIYRWI